MERTHVLDLMGNLKLYGMRNGYDEVMAAGIKRQHEPPRIVGDLLSAEIAEKQARSIKYQMALAKLPLAKDIDDFDFTDTPVNQALLGDDITETEVMRLYDISRSATNRILEQLSALGVVERKLGYGWRFLDSLKDLKARQEAYKFRLLIEPQALVQSGFSLPGNGRWRCARHHSFLSQTWQHGKSIAFFEMNADFHLGLAAAFGNRYIRDAVNRQNHLRRLLNYDWNHGQERVAIVCREHLEMLDRLEVGDNEIASLLMHRHIEKTMKLRAPFED